MASNLVEGNVVLAGVEGLALAVDLEVPAPAAGVVMRAVIPYVGNAPARAQQPLSSITANSRSGSAFGKAYIVWPLADHCHSCNVL